MKDFYEFASEDQLMRTPKNLRLEEINTIDHVINIISENDKSKLEWVNSQKIMDRTKSFRYI